MMTSHDSGRLDRLVESLVAALSPLRIILFGSHARGEDRPDSDYDLIVVVETDLPPAQRTFMANKAVRHLGIPVDMLVYTPREFEELARWPSSVVAAALAEGSVLHEAA